MNKPIMWPNWAYGKQCMGVFAFGNSDKKTFNFGHEQKINEIEMQIDA